jgi:Na+/H+ antiporter NhaD/arsenite permease-like protein
MAGILSTAIFAVSLFFIFREKVHRTIVGIVGAVVMVGVGLALGFYNEEMAIEAIDFETLGLLLGMMILVALLQPTGFFEYVAIQSGRLSKGRPLYLLILLGSITTILSMFLDNVTTVVLIAPITILICEILSTSPVPFLISEALLSNTGGVGTLVGDPPNVLIGSAVPFTFNDFLVHSLPVVLITWITALALLVWLFRHDLQATPEMERRVKQLDPSKALDHPQTARKVLIVLGVAVLFFFVHHIFHYSPAFIALAAAGIALLWVQPDDMAKTLEHVEWPVLLFFSALFVMIGGLDAAGVLAKVAEFVASVSHINPVLLGVIMIWVVAGLSAVVDNIPITIALIPVIQGLGASGIDVQPLWWALVFGAGFGGNGTIIGSTANVVVVSLSEKTRTPITAVMWSRRGLPVMLLACTVSSIVYALIYPLFSR